MSAPLWIAERDVAALTMTEAIAALRAGLEREAGGGAANLEKTHLRLEGGANMHAIGAAFPSASLCGVKTWVHTKGGATPIELLWDAEDGRLLAVIEAFALGQLRTAAIAGVATDRLAAEAAGELALCGTGKQALAQVAAVAAVRPLSRVRVYGRDPERREAMVHRIGEALGLRAEGFADVAAAVDGAPIVTLVTRASQSFLASDRVARGAHVNAMGAITPERSEFAPALLGRCAVVAVDSVGQARRLASELRAFYGEGDAWSAVVPLSEWLAKGQGRPAGADVTLFKSLGMGISDLALAHEVFRRAQADGTARELPAPRRVPLRLRGS